MSFSRSYDAPGMFDEMEDEEPDVTPESPDRAIVWAIYMRGAAPISREEGWAILHERYPDDPRFLLLNTYAELSEARNAASAQERAGVATPSYLLSKMERLLGRASDALQPQLRDLVAFGSTLFVGAKGEEVAAVAALSSKLGADANASLDDRDRAGIRLRRFEREVVKELHDRTEGGKPLGVAVSSAPLPGADWASAVADKSAPRRKYAADARMARGELVEHPKFGVGVVTGTEPGKVTILFESGARKLVAGG